MSRNSHKAGMRGGWKHPQSAMHSKGNSANFRHPHANGKSKIKLTISLLVSNRIDTVRKCLQSIKPILDALPSELIVVDTVGQEYSDGSLSIAREYTDRIIRFEWCDDFAAARNAGLKVAGGEWFLYLDDDEWFDDVSAIIDFLKTDDGSYNFCTYRVRNYADFGGQRYRDAYVGRMFRMNEKVRFKDRIHECLVGAMSPVKTLDVFVHHYGYVFESAEAFEKHSVRNIQPLEEMLREEPGNLRTIEQLAQEYWIRREYDKTEVLCQKALQENLFPYPDNYCSLLSYYAVHALIAMKKWDAVKELSVLMLERPDITELAKCNICFQLHGCAFAVFNSEQLIENVDAYFRFVDILDGDPDKLSSQQMLQLFECQLESSRALILADGLGRAVAIGNSERSWNYIRRITRNPGEKFLIIEKCMPVMIRFAASTNTFDDLYALVMPCLDNENVASCFLASAQAYAKTLREYERPLWLYGTLAKLPLDKPYIVLLKMCAAEQAHDFKMLSELFDRYFDLDGADALNEVMQIAYRNGLDLSKCAHKIYIGQWIIEIHTLADANSLDQARGFLQYLKGIFPENAPEVLSLEADIELKTLKENLAKNNSIQNEGFNRYVELFYEYNLALNNAGNFTEERCNYLCPDARTAYYLKQSLEYGRKGERLSQVRMLKNALRLKRDLVDVAKLILQNLEKQSGPIKTGQQAEANTEFIALAVRLKKIATDFVKKGDAYHARNLLEQLNQLLPGDPEVVALNNQLNREAKLSG